MKHYPDICGECGRNIPELEPATRIMQQYPSRSQSQKMTLVCRDCKPLDHIPVSTCKGCRRPLRLLSGFAGPFCSDRCFQLARHGGVPFSRASGGGESSILQRSDARSHSTWRGSHGNRKKSV